MASTLRLVTLRVLRQNKDARASTYRSLSISSIRAGTVIPYKLSDIGEGIRDVVVKEWFVKPGDKVSQFDNICEVQSDKASATITSRYDGVIKSLHYKIDDVALVGQPLVDIEVDDDKSVVVESKPVEPDDVVRQAVNADEPRSEQIDKVLATPAVRKIAMEHNLRLADVPASGKAGRVLKEDILAYLGKIQVPKPEVPVTVVSQPISSRSIPSKRYAKAMWKTMTQSLSIPHFVYSDECNVTKLSEHRDEAKEALKGRGISLSLMPFFIKAASRALEEIPELNAWIDEENQTVKIVDNHNISIAMDTPEGLVVPNIKNVQNLTIVDIAKELNRLQNLGKTASLPLNDLTEGTFSLSNIGVVGGTYTKPVILTPQIVIGALGKVQKLPRFDKDMNVYPASIVSVSWAADHRVVDGVTMAKYSNLWKYYLENPVHLMLGV